MSLTEIREEYFPSLFLTSTPGITNPEAVRWSGGTFYGDASGGKFTSLKPLRRCGCGIALVDEEGNLIFGIFFNLPGLVQTVPRAELYALLFVVENLDGNAVATYVIDNQGVHDLFHQGPALCKLSINADL